MKERRRPDSSVLVIGSSGGIGSSICDLLLQSDTTVIGMDIAPAREGLTNHELFDHIQVDITDRDCIRRAIENHLPQKRLSAVIYAAGIYDHAPLAEVDIDRLERIFAVNVFGFAEMVRHTFTRILAGRGRYIVISSETALIPMPFQVYGTSKRMLEVYLDSLRQELDLVSIPVITIRPGAHDTALLTHSRSKLAEYSADSVFSPFLDVVRNKGEEVIDRGAADPEAVGRAVLRALNDSRPRHTYHVNVALHFRILKVLPDRLVRSLFKRILGK